MTDFQTPMTRIKGLRSSHTGLFHWWWQRVSALILIPLGLWFFWEVLCHTQAEYLPVLVWASRPWNSVGLVLLTGMIFYHSSLGLQVIIEDYVPHPAWKTYFIIKVKVVNFALAVLSWFFIIRIVITGTSS